jgi:hypothetical protein
LPLCIGSPREGARGGRDCLLDQHTSVAGTACTYDDNGNLAFDGQFRYYYDCESRLTDINDAPVRIPGTPYLFRY